MLIAVTAATAPGRSPNGSAPTAPKRDRSNNRPTAKAIHRGCEAERFSSSREGVESVKLLRI